MKGDSISSISFYKISVTVILAVFLASCGKPPSISFLLKEYSYAALTSDPAELQKLKKACAARNLTPEFISIDRKQEESLRKLIENTKASIIYLDPLFRESPLVYAKRYPAKLFFSLKRTIEGKNISNLLLVNFDRVTIMEEAGAAAGNILKEGKLPPVKPRVKTDNIENAGDTDISGNIVNTDTQTDTSVKRAGIIVFPASRQSNDEISAFIRGFSQTAGRDLLVYNEINDVNDRTGIKKIMDDMKTRGVVLFFFRLYISNTYCLDALIREGGYAITEDADKLPDYGKITVFSIDEDFPLSLDAVFSTIRKKPGVEAYWEANEVKGAVSIRWGNILPPPSSGTANN